MGGRNGCVRVCSATRRGCKVEEPTAGSLMIFGDVRQTVGFDLIWSTYSGYFWIFLDTLNYIDTLFGLLDHTSHSRRQQEGCTLAAQTIWEAEVMIFRTSDAILESIWRDIVQDDMLKLKASQSRCEYSVNIIVKDTHIYIYIYTYYIILYYIILYYIILYTYYIHIIYILYTYII